MLKSEVNHSIFASPFSWRYGTKEMRIIWSEAEKRRLWRQIWIALARAQRDAGLISSAQVDDLAQHGDSIDVERALEIEAEIHHDLMAEVLVFAEQCKIGGPIIHFGATSADIEDNADALRIRSSLDLIIAGLRDTLLSLSERIDAESDTAAMAFTHLQPAEPTTIGYRLALYGQDLLDDYLDLVRIRQSIRGKGIKGAVGTSASYTDLLRDTGLTAGALEENVMRSLGLVPFPVASQTYTRKQDWRVISALSGLASSLYKFAFDLRLMQSPAVGEWQEPFASAQVGSSAMPFKRNPINAEKLDSLGRIVSSLVHVAWDNAAHSLLERTLDDSANRREILPVAFLTTDEMLRVSKRLIDGFRIDRAAVQRNLDRFGSFAASERVLMAVVKAGADRQAMHEHLRELSMHAWSVFSTGAENPLVLMVCESTTLRAYLTAEQLRVLMNAHDYIGDAPERARSMAQAIQREVTSV